MCTPLSQVVWRYLLNVYPDGLTGQERMDYMKKKTREYERLKREWPAHVAPGDLDLIRGNVMKDVLRTDRTHPYYAGSEDNPHLSALANLLTTYAITHPKVCTNCPLPHALPASSPMRHLPPPPCTTCPLLHAPPVPSPMHHLPPPSCTPLLSPPPLSPHTRVYTPDLGQIHRFGFKVLYTVRSLSYYDNVLDSNTFL